MAALHAPEQLTLDIPAPLRPAPVAVQLADRPVLNLHAYDLIVICSSAGKDSMALLAYLAKLIREQGYRGRVVVLHNDLGVTRSGEPVEWPDVQELARELLCTCGPRFEVADSAEPPHGDLG